MNIDDNIAEESSDSYDDSEFAAIKLVRLASTETEDNPLSAEMEAVLEDMYRRHGSDGITGLALALSRQYAAAAAVVAHNRGLSVEEFLDDFEQHKLQQTTEDEW